MFWVVSVKVKLKMFGVEFYKNEIIQHVWGAFSKNDSVKIGCKLLNDGKNYYAPGCLSIFSLLKSRGVGVFFSQ